MKMKSLRYQQGTEVVEFAVTSMLLFLLLFAIIEFSVALFDKATLTNASREGARTGILFRDDDPRNVVAEDGDIQQAVDSYSGYLLSLGGPAELTTNIQRVDTSGDGIFGRGDDVIVTVTYPYQFLIVPAFVGTLGGALGDSLNLSASTTMRAE